MKRRVVESSWNVMAHGDPREGKWRGNRRMEWVASTLHTTSEHGVSSITTADAHASAASSRLNWRPHRFKWTRPFRRKTKSVFCACAVTFQTQSTNYRHFGGNCHLHCNGRRRNKPSWRKIRTIWGQEKPARFGPPPDSIAPRMAQTLKCIYHVPYIAEIMCNEM